MTLQNDLITVPTVEDLTRRQFFSSALAAALLIACSDDEEAEPTPQSTTRTITTKYGTYDIPTEPKRLVVMENRYELETAVALGLNPIGSGHEHSFLGGPSNWVAPWVPWTPAAGAVTFSSVEPDIEHLLTLQPDLIFSKDRFLDGDNAWKFASLSQVAPVLPVGGMNWRDDLLRAGEWLGREAQARKAIEEHDALGEAIRTRHARRIASARVAFGSVSAQLVNLRALNQASPQAQALTTLGGNVLPFDFQANGFHGLSMERIGELRDADAIMVWSGSQDALNSFVNENPLWQLLPAVQAGRVLVVRPNNPGEGSVYTAMECLRHWDQLYAKLS